MIISPESLKASQSATAAVQLEVDDVAVATVAAMKQLEASGASSIGQYEISGSELKAASAECDFK